MAKETVIIGSSNMDLNIYLKRFPNPGETVTGGTFKQFLGGKGANQAVAAVRSGARTIFIGKIGNDSFGEQMISQLSKEGINMNYIIRDSEEASGVAFIMIDESGENMISVAPGSNYRLTPEEVQSCAEIIKSSSSTIVQMEIPMNTIKEIFNIASYGNTIKILNPAPLKPIPLEVLEKVDILVPNEGELYSLCSLVGFEHIPGEGEVKIENASKIISELGITYILTTLGRRGCIIYSKNEEKFVKIPAIKVKAIDTVGAGDCFIGVLASRLSSGGSIVNAVKYATVAASIAVTRKGAQNSMPYLDEIEEKIDQLDRSLDTEGN